MLSKKEAGSAFIELTLTLPVFLLIIMGIYQYGYILAAHINLRNASAIAARVAILDAADATEAEAAATAAAQKAVQPMLKSGSDFLQVLFSDSADVGGYSSSAREIKLTYNLPLFFPVLVPGNSGGILVLNATAKMR